MMVTLEGIISNFKELYKQTNKENLGFSLIVRRFEDIQFETRSIGACMRRMLAEKSEVAKEMHS